MKDSDLQYTDLPVGEILRRARMHYGQSLIDIEKNLRIKAPQVEAIENGDFSKLPGRVYAIGFIRSYSEYLGLDGDKMVHLFKVQSGGKTANPELHFPVAASESKIPPLWLAGLSLFLFMVVIAIWWGMNSRDRSSVTEVPPVSGSIRNTEPYGPQVPAGFTSPEEAVVSVQQEGILLIIEQNSWVEIKDETGKALVSRVLKAGEKYYVPDRPDLTMSLGNAGGLVLEVEGKRLNKLGEKGKVLRNVPLDATFLKEKFAAE